MFARITLFSAIFTISVQKYANIKCLNTADFSKENVKTEEYLGEWQMVHLRSMFSEGFECPSPKLKVTPVTNKDIAQWKTKCFHKLDISILDETKFELKVAFPDDFEIDYTIIKREKNEDHIFFPSCKFEKIALLRNGQFKMWMATREEDNAKVPVAVSIPPGHDFQCVLNHHDNLYYFFC